MISNQFNAPADQQSPLHQVLRELIGRKKFPQWANHRQAAVPFASRGIVHQNLSGKCAGISLTAAQQLSGVTRAPHTQPTNLSQSAQGIGQCRVAEVPLCELRHQLLKLILEQLRVWQQRLFTVRSVANVVSLEGRRATWISCVFQLERRDGQPHGPDGFGGVY